MSCLLDVYQTFLCFDLNNSLHQIRFFSLNPAEGHTVCTMLNVQYAIFHALNNIIFYFLFLFEQNGSLTNNIVSQTCTLIGQVK